MPDCGAEMKENEVRITFALVGDVCEMARGNCIFFCERNVQCQAPNSPENVPYAKSK